MSDKTFINGFYIKEKLFNDGGSVLNVSINVSKFIDDLKKHEEKGYVNLVISKNRNGATDKGNTHNISLSTFKPTPRDNQNTQSDNHNSNQDYRPDNKPSEPDIQVDENESGSDLPF